MRFTVINRVRFCPRLLSQGTQRVWTTAEMHTILGSSAKTSPEELRELYLARVREIHPDTATETPTIALNELRGLLFSFQQVFTILNKTFMINSWKRKLKRTRNPQLLLLRIIVLRNICKSLQCKNFFTQMPFDLSFSYRYLLFLLRTHGTWLQVDETIK